MLSVYKSGIEKMQAEIILYANYFCNKSFQSVISDDGKRVGEIPLWWRRLNTFCLLLKLTGRVTFGSAMPILGAR